MEALTQHTCRVSNERSSSCDRIEYTVDPAKLHPMAGIDDKLDYLLLDDDKTSELPGVEGAIPSRGWSDDLSYGTGTMYLGGKQSSLTFGSIPVVVTYLFALTCSIRGLGLFFLAPGALTLSSMTPSLIVFATSHAYFLSRQVSPLVAHGACVRVHEDP